MTGDASTTEDADEQPDDYPIDATVEERLRRLENDLAAERQRRKELEAENEQLQERVDDLEDELETRASVVAPSDEIQDIRVEAQDGTTLPLGLGITSKASQSDVEWLEEKVEKLLEGKADVVVRGGAEEDALPIETVVAMLQADSADDLSANKRRAGLVFPAFGGRAEAWGQKMKLDSNQVRQVLEEKTGKSADAWNRNTVQRVMRRLAELTSEREKSERDPFDEDNLIRVRKGEKRLQLVAERDEWQEFCDDVASS